MLGAIDVAHSEANSMPEEQLLRNMGRMDNTDLNKHSVFRSHVRPALQKFVRRAQMHESIRIRFANYKEQNRTFCAALRNKRASEPSSGRRSKGRRARCNLTSRRFRSHWRQKPKWPRQGTRSSWGRRHHAGFWRRGQRLTRKYACWLASSAEDSAPPHHRRKWRRDRELAVRSCGAQHGLSKRV